MSNERIPVLTTSSNPLWAPESLRIKQVEEQVSALRTSVICAFNQLLDLKDLNTGVHSTRLAEWGMRVGQELGLEEGELQNLEVAALLHDIGKVGIPDAILKKPGKLDDEEYALMKKHPEYGWAVLRMLPGFERAALDILHHHESFDGKGYPAGLKETEIPIVSRIVTVIDAFDAMTSARRSRPPPNPMQRHAIRSSRREILLVLRASRNGHRLRRRRHFRLLRSISLLHSRNAGGSLSRGVRQLCCRFSQQFAGLCIP
jgi:response regulator RpfG family c-di-GMP phosphodiesterase